MHGALAQFHPVLFGFGLQNAQPRVPFHADFTHDGTGVNLDSSGTIHIGGDGSGGVTFSGGGSVTATIDPPVLAPFKVSVGFGVSNSGFSVKLGDLPSIDVSW